MNARGWTMGAALVAALLAATPLRADDSTPDPVVLLQGTWKEHTCSDLSADGAKNLLRVFEELDQRGVAQTSDDPPKGALVLYHTPYGSGGRIAVSQGDGTVLFPGVKDPLPIDTIPGRLGWIPAPRKIVFVVVTKPAVAPVDTAVPAMPTPNPNAIASNPAPSQPAPSQPQQSQPQQSQPQQSQPQQSQPQQSQPQQSQPQQSQPQQSQPANNNVPPAKPDDGSMEQSPPMNASESDREVLARIVKGEIGPNAPREGQVAIAAVVLNRVRSGQFGKSIPEVAHAPYQFSCYNSNYRQKLYYGPIPKYAYDAADAALKGENPVPGCTYYFNPFFASPTWAKNMILVKTIGSTKSTRHDFYKPANGKAKA